MLFVYLPWNILQSNSPNFQKLWLFADEMYCSFLPNDIFPVSKNSKFHFIFCIFSNLFCTFIQPVLRFISNFCPQNISKLKWFQMYFFLNQSFFTIRNALYFKLHFSSIKYSKINSILINHKNNIFLCF